MVNLNEKNQNFDKIKEQVDNNKLIDESLNGKFSFFTTDNLRQRKSLFSLLNLKKENSKTNIY
ncbi:hypothetical protein BpHYR1_005294 [Brachionus plicatilis]|uniref:Uncharacterized protein n=1 Tax=Brachionus plicatilis TaxID=10195 RepID=A0A3M7S6E5_BRAPC|nr:hypothetical protein BpHYR1_005294 [Brachionus plicatilis]